MIPVIELKGAIPFGMSKDVFGSKALSPMLAWLASATGSLVPAFFLVWLFIPTMNWLKNTKVFKNLSQKLEDKFKNNAQKINNNAQNSKLKELKKCLGLIIFVAIPLPLTGAYTGSAIAAYMELGYLKSLLCIFIGNIIAGGIVVLLCTVFSGYEVYIFMAFIIVLIAIILIRIIKNIILKSKITNNAER